MKVNNFGRKCAYEKTKKILSMFVITCLLTVSGLFSVSSFATESYTWASSKIPGSYITTYTNRTMTYYAGTVYFKATQLYTNSSYIAGKCEGVDVTINNQNHYVLVSVKNTPVGFTVVPVLATTMKFKMYVDHNASYTQQATGSGNIYY